MLELPASLRNLPGVSSTTTASSAATVAQGAVSTGEAAALVWEGSAASAQSAQRMDTAITEYTFDLKQNTDLRIELARAGTPADGRGIASVAAQANRHPEEFAAMVDAARSVASSMGQNPAAQEQFQQAKAAFVDAASIPANQAGDVMYLVMRVAQDSVTQNEQTVRESIQKQIENNLKLIDALKQYEKGLQKTSSQLAMNPIKEVEVVESDFRLDPSGNVERVADSQRDGDIKGSSEVLVKPGTGGQQFIKGGPEVTGVSLSTTDRPRVVSMDRTKVAAEIKETQMQISALEKVNAQLRAMGSTAATSDITVRTSWYLDDEAEEV